MRLTNPTGRKTEARALHTNIGTYYFSYQTLIAFRSNLGVTKVRLENVWGPTTGRHINEMGLREFDIVTPEEFDQHIGEKQ